MEKVTKPTAELIGKDCTWNDFSCRIVGLMGDDDDVRILIEIVASGKVKIVGFDDIRITEPQ